MDDSRGERQQSRSATNPLSVKVRSVRSFPAEDKCTPFAKWRVSHARIGEAKTAARVRQSITIRPRTSKWEIVTDSAPKVREVVIGNNTP